ncbi:MAG: aminoacyl-tRNA hydrolase [Flavobacteriales bacterium]|nr:aminoacyl-tRNA hydrolase [Flavobacteriales bacterium]
MDKSILIKELSFKTARSSGAGGQHVNKVSSKVILSFDIDNSEGLNMREKKLLKKALASRLTTEGILNLSCEESKSQHQNKDLVIKRFLSILKKGLIVPKRRIATKPTKASKRRKLDDKKRRGQTKALRNKPKLD